jgi:tRNA-dihydrouridine synthase 1
MFNAKLFAKDVKYRDEHWAGLKDGLGGGGPNDRPLVVQVQHPLFLPSSVSLVTTLIAAFTNSRTTSLF